MTRADHACRPCARTPSAVRVSCLLGLSTHQGGMKTQFDITEPPRPELRLVRDDDPLPEPSPLPTRMPHRLLTGDEVAWWLQVPRGALDAWREKGSAPKAYRLGKHLRWCIEDVVAWLEERAA